MELERGRFRSLASLILVVNVVGELQQKRTLALSRGFLAAARLSCYYLGLAQKLGVTSEIKMQKSKNSASTASTGSSSLLLASYHIWIVPVVYNKKLWAYTLPMLSSDVLDIPGCIEYNMV